MSVEQARDKLIYTMEVLESLATNHYDEDGTYLIDRIECDLEIIEDQIRDCKEALMEYAEALESEDDDYEE